MGNSHIDEILRQNFVHTELSEVTKNEMWNKILAAVPTEFATENGRHYRMRNVLKRRIVTTAATVTAVAMGGILIYMTVLLPSGSRERGSTTPAQHNRAVEEYYKKILGFQPMLPTYIPRGSKINERTVLLGDNNGRQSANFRIELLQENGSAPQVPVIINETMSSDYQKIQGQEFEFLQGQYSLDTKKTLTINGLTVTIITYQRKLPPARIATVDRFVKVVTLSNDGVRYSVNYMGPNSGTDELIKILESLTRPDENQPTGVTGNGSISEAQRAANFKVVLPSFIPRGFKVGGSGVSGQTVTKDGNPSSTMLPPLTDAHTSSVASNKLSSSFHITYTKGQGSIEISENHPANGDFISKYSQNTRGFHKTIYETIKGQRIHVSEEKPPAGKGTYIIYSYYWRNAATDVSYGITDTFYDSKGSPWNHQLYYKATMDQVVASMLG